MTMASSPPSEEERRLLREYRLTTIPSRRSSCSPATTTSNGHLPIQTNGHNNHHHHHHHKHHHSGHHHHHHHHNSNHRRLKVTTPTHELSPDELNRMIELSSELSYLKLVSPQNLPSDALNNGNYCNDIFEKVDYIKRINIRRKAFRKLKKARSVQSV